MRTFILKINEEGKVDWTPTQLAIWQDWCRDRKGKQIRMKVEDYKGTKSQAQLGYWFGALVPEFANYHRMTINDAQDLMRQEFNYRYVKTKDTAYKVGKSLAQSNHETMSKAIENAIRYFEENGIPVPDPNDYNNQLDKAELI